MKNFNVIRSEKDYEEALHRLDEILDSDTDTPEGDEVLILSLLIEHFEDQHFPIQSPDPIEAIKIRLNDLGLRQKDLIGVAGSTKGRVSEILNKKRPLTLPVIRKLESFLRIPAEILIQPYDLNFENNPVSSMNNTREKEQSKRKVTAQKRVRAGMMNEPKPKNYRKD